MKQVLIIDDDPRNIFALKAVLKAKGFNCISCTSAAEGLSIVNSNPDQIGIILIDMMMPDMDGYEALGRLKGEPGTKHLPVVAVTAQAMVGDRERCLDAGADDYVSKPINVDALLVVIGKFLN